jgi:hypothetical protein
MPAKAFQYPPQSERTEFVFVDRRGHAIGVVEGAYAKTADKAWDMMCEDRARERRWRDEGVTCVHVPFAEYVANHYECIGGKCSHVAVSA